MNVQFNGEHGCTSCLCKGRSHQLGPRRHVWIYPYTEVIQYRTLEDSVGHADEATPDNPTKGVKGPTALSNSMPDFIKGMAIDRMHGVDGGVIKKLLTLLFDPAYANYNFSLNHVIDVINARLTSLKPPKFTHRMPRSVQELVPWKSSELKIWLFYYSIPIFQGIMLPDYFENYLCLIVGVSILSQDQILAQDIAIARELLKKFVYGFEQLYGIEFCSMNIHQLLHLADCVERLDPTWVYSCYEYENIYGELLRLIYGTSHIDSQVSNSQWEFLKMKRQLERMPEGEMKNFCLKKKKQVKIIEQVFNHCFSVGTYKYKTLQEFSDAIAQALITIGINENINIRQYLRVLKNKKLYVSEMYTRAKQTQSSVVQYIDNNNDKHFGMIFCFVKISNCNFRMPGMCQCASRHLVVLEKIISDGVYTATGNFTTYTTSSLLHRCHTTYDIVVVPVEALITVCIFMNVENHQYVAIPINEKELE